MVSAWWAVVLGLVGLERLAELVLSKKNAAWSFARGGVEHGRGHYPVMVVLHTAFLVGCLLEPGLTGFTVSPIFSGVMVGLCIAAQALRWWCITTLGPRWNTRVIVVPGLAPVEAGPYRHFAHPNYVAVVVEGLALPLANGAVWTAVIFTVLNALLLRTRIQVEDRALAILRDGSAG